MRCEIGPVHQVMPDNIVLGHLHVHDISWQKTQQRVNNVSICRRWSHNRKKRNVSALYCLALPYVVCNCFVREAQHMLHVAYRVRETVLLA